MRTFVENGYLLGLVLLACVPASGSTSDVRKIDPVIQKAIDDFVTTLYFKSSKISKLGLAVVKDNGEILYTTGYGMADQKKGIPNGNQTQFLIGSLTKSFTATIAVKVLHERFPELGEAVLDTPVMTLMPSSINFTLIDRYRSEHFTFRDLLSHRMCIFRDDLQILAEPFSETAEIVYRQRYAEGICGMRSGFQYNNEMFVIAAELIGILANKTYTQLMNELLQEIGMNNSRLLTKSDDFSKMPFRAQPYYVLDNVSHPMNPDLVKRVVVSHAAGGLYVTPNDMVKYMKFRLNKGSVDGKQIIPKDVMEWLTEPSNHLPKILYRSAEGPFANAPAYGLGMILGTFDGWEYNFHNGYVQPYYTLMSLFPSQNLGIFTSSNEGPAYLDPIVVHAYIFEILKGIPPKDAIKKVRKLWKGAEATRMEKERNKEKGFETFLQTYGEGSLKENRDIVGKYGSGGSGDAEILMKLNPQTNKTDLYVQYGKCYRGWMETFRGSVYQITWDTDVIQDNYCSGDPKGFGYVGLANNTPQFFLPTPGNLMFLGKFTRGVSLDTLPIIPWDPNSC